MNFTVHEASLFLHRLSEKVPAHRDIEVVLAPTMLALQTLSLQVNRRQFKLAAQNCYWRDHGAYTGEVSARQLHGIADFVIIGHSERRHIFHESDKDIRSKVQAAVRNHISPILCVGETLLERSSGETADILTDQLTGGLANLTSDELKHVVIAYEPVWAIGTGQNALPHDVEFAVQKIRAGIKHLYGVEASKTIRVLYGGSVNADNAPTYLAARGVDGLLIGGASLKIDEFSKIVEQAHEETKK